MSINGNDKKGIMINAFAIHGSGVVVEDTGKTST
jgi:hypothetical protein